MFPVHNINQRWFNYADIKHFLFDPLLFVQCYFNVLKKYNTLKQWQKERDKHRKVKVIYRLYCNKLLDFMILYCILHRISVNSELYLKM